MLSVKYVYAALFRKEINHGNFVCLSLSSKNFQIHSFELPRSNSKPHFRSFCLESLLKFFFHQSMPTFLQFFNFWNSSEMLRNAKKSWISWNTYCYRAFDLKKYPYSPYPLMTLQEAWQLSVLKKNLILWFW